jgi:hypothetical protein
VISLGRLLAGAAAAAVLDLLYGRVDVALRTDMIPPPPPD